MTGKQLKEWAKSVPDSASIEFRIAGFSQWERNCTVRFVWSEEMPAVTGEAPTKGCP